LFENCHLFLEQNKTQMFPVLRTGSDPNEADQADSWMFVERYEYSISVSLAAYEDAHMAVHRSKNTPAPHPHAQDTAIERTNNQKVNLKGAYAELAFLREYFSMLLFVRVTQNRRPPGFLTLPSDMVDTFPNIFAAYTEIRRAVLALHASHVMGVLDADTLTSQRLTLERLTTPLAEAHKLQAKLKMQVDIMEAYTDATLEKELAQEMTRYLDDGIGPILEVMRCFDTLVRLVQCKEPL
jgi:hypothetical protein